MPLLLLCHGAGVMMTTCYFAAAYAQSQLSTFALMHGRSGIVRPADQDAALELLRPHHMLSAQLRGFLFFGVANAIGTRLHDAAKCLEGGTGGAGRDAGRGVGGAGAPWGALAPAARDAQQQLAAAVVPAADVQAAGWLYRDGGSKHNGALAVLAAAPKFLLLDFSRVKGMDATAARTLAALFRWGDGAVPAWQETHG